MLTQSVKKRLKYSATSTCCMLSLKREYSTARGAYNGYTGTPRSIDRNKAKNEAICVETAEQDILTELDCRHLGQKLLVLYPLRKVG
eukprot:6178896-Pleurochrysis_carterae.AAC.3